MTERREITAELLVGLSTLLLQKLTAEQLLRSTVQYNRISCQTLANLMAQDDFFDHHYSAMECLYMAQATSDYICDRAEEHLRDCVRGSINVFDLLAETLYLLLTKENDEVRSRYTELLNWRQLVSCVGEELPVAVMHALIDMEHGTSDRTNYSWDYVTAHNNRQLNNITARGIAEHHYHVWGSTPYFQVSWLSLMNHPAEMSYIRNFQELSRENRWDTPLEKTIDEWITPYGTATYTHDVDPWSLLHLRAALIRSYLCTRLAGIRFNMRGRETWRAQDIYQLLQEPEQLQLLASELDSAVSSLIGTDMDCMDYALHLFTSRIGKNQALYGQFAGERWFIYQMMTDIYRTAAFQKLDTTEHQLFYIYLLLCSQLRGQLVQNNERPGFDNFEQIQNRKGDFVADLASQRWITRLAVLAPLKTKPHLRQLELRMMPRDSAEENARRIREIEESVQEYDGRQDEEKDTLTPRFYYVLHFAKRPDDVLRDSFSTSPFHPDFTTNLLECRHYRLRGKLRRQMLALIEFREKYPEAAARVRGIDACSQEIGCRPEVFGPVFRLLGRHTCTQNIAGEEVLLPALGKTYHAGEDFLDPTDGLRAISEAVHFLDLDCGSRLGHAMALGIQVEDWYAEKNYRVTLPVQDLLDNAAWLDHALQHYKIEDSRLLQRELRTLFDYWFHIVYLNHMAEDDLRVIMRRAQREYGDDEKKRNYKEHICNFNIEEYYNAWTLRGDCPDLYRNGYYSAVDAPRDDWDRCCTNQNFPVRFETRYVAECSLLNYYYHFDPSVRAEGNRRVTVKVTPAYVRGVQAVQCALRAEIAARGIAVETNPSSNVLIGTFRRYEKHPILSFYNRGLPLTAEEDANCPQMNVSINTDDKGVFYTDLDSEYALLARSLELLEDENGGQLFKKDDIYTWLDHIRVMGLEQGFPDSEEERRRQLSKERTSFM